jgi:hypothetical protein
VKCDIPKSIPAIPGFDAREWAKRFVETVKEHPDIPTDEATMRTWFASAILRGYNERVRRANAETPGPSNESREEPQQQKEEEDPREAGDPPEHPRL